jgi:hypothetical protein
MTNVLPPGTYTIIITEEDLAANNMRSADDRYIFLGEWQTAFDPDGHYIVKRTSPDGGSHMVIAEGQYALSADQLTFTDVEMGSACMDSSGVQVGSYRWALDGRALTLTAIEDKCSDRNFSLTVHPWSKVELPPGTYVTTITQEDFLARDDLHLVARSILLGEWEMTLTEDNRYSHDEVTESGRLVVAEEGYYTLTRDQMVFNAERGAYACIGPQGIYQWALDGKTLTLTTVEDPCPERNTLNSAHPWTRQD